MSMNPDSRAGGNSRHPPAAVLRLVAAVSLPVLLLCGAACDSDSGGGTTITELCLEFTGASAAAPGTVSSRTDEDSTSCNLAEVEIVATDVSDVFAFQSTVVYDPDVAVFLGFSVDGSALESDGADVTVVAEEELFGTVVIGATRVATDEGVDIVGTGLLIKLVFGRLGFDGSSGAVTLDEQCLVDSGEGPQLKTTPCSGGTLAVL